MKAHIVFISELIIIFIHLLKRENPFTLKSWPLIAESLNELKANHEDKNPSMGIKQGDTNVIVTCFSKGCDRKELLNYFYNRLPYYQGGK